MQIKPYLEVVQEQLPGFVQQKALFLNKALVFLGLTILLTLSACGGNQVEPVVLTAQETASTIPANTPTHAPTSTKASVDETITSEMGTPTVDLPTNTPAAEIATLTAATVEPTEEMVEVEPTEEMAEATVEPPPEQIDWLTVGGKTEENLTFLGNPEASVTIIDYSDFM
jgi:hypothetical protein